MSISLFDQGNFVDLLDVNFANNFMTRPKYILTMPIFSSIPNLLAHFSTPAQRFKNQVVGGVLATKVKVLLEKAAKNKNNI